MAPEIARIARSGWPTSSVAARVTSAPDEKSSPSPVSTTAVVATPCHLPNAASRSGHASAGTALRLAGFERVTVTMPRLRPTCTRPVSARY
jgi:hypothetical protein